MSKILKKYESSNLVVLLQELSSMNGESTTYDVIVMASNSDITFRVLSFPDKGTSAECFGHFVSLINKLVFEDFE